jgi:cytoskeletal protein RodZ
VSIGNSSHDAPSSAPDDPPSTTPEPAGPTIGQSLAEARRDAGMTVEAVSTATRVRVPIVQAIEKDDFTRCGGDVYARGHIRAFARAVHLDPAPLVARFDAEHGGRPAPTPVAPLYEGERIRPDVRRPNWTAAMIAAIVAVIGFVGFTLLSGGNSGAGSGSGGQPVAGHASQGKTGTRPSATGAPSPTPTASAQPSNSPIAAVPADEVVVKLTAGKGKSWISATGGDGTLLFQGLLQNGQSKTFTDGKKISLIIGNAGAIDMFVNGKDLGPAGSNGQLVRTQFTPGDPQQG